MSQTISEFTILETIQCCKCGIVFAVPQSLKSSLIQTHASFYCPNGHGQSFAGKSEAERLREQLQTIQVQLRAEKCVVLDERDKREKLERKLHRVKNGVCPDCKRSFCNLAQHMATKHPK